MTDRARVHRNEARTYDLRDGELVNARRVYRSEFAAHNGIFSNVLDLVQWDAALYSDRLLSHESREAMWSRTRLADGTRYPYGFGWVLSRRAGRPVQFHGGATGTALYRFPEDTLTVIVLTNLGGSGAQDLATRVAEMMIPEMQDGCRSISSTCVRIPESTSANEV